MKNLSLWRYHVGVPRLNDLKRCPLFHDVSPEAVRDAAAVVIERRYAAGEVLIEQDQPGEALYLIVEGVVRVSRVSLGSRERVMGDVYAPGVVGETAVLAQSERSATITALEPTRALLLYRDHFSAILRRHPGLLWNLARSLADRITALNDELIAFGHNTEAALAHVAVQQYHQRAAAGLERPEYLPLGTVDLMQRLSSSRETVARVVRKLEKQGYLHATPSHIELLDVAGLETLGLDDDSE
ncbi:Crp/Fnr family transcriptional regulator [Deinococcus lacus]|uniref:Crp/Fnr family transcriptional regulator n=1 Tax=Deinococcus lacus TaxID=392561 RepID=A0ABW1YCT0_9DEIO